MIGEPIKQGTLIQQLEINFSEETKKFLLKALQAEAEWIPVSERLPSEIGWYLITVQGVNRFTDVDYYYGNSEWDEVSSKQKVIAWMPLPQPYREESEVEE